MLVIAEAILDWNNSAAVSVADCWIVPVSFGAHVYGFK